MSWWLPQYLTTSGESFISDGLVPSARVCGADELFGASSSLDGSVIDSSIQLLDFNSSVNLTLSLIVLTIIVSYCYTMYRYGDMLRWSAKNLLSVSGAIFMFSSPTMNFTRFIRVGVWLNILCTAAVVSFFLVQGEDMLLLVFGGIFLSLWVLRLWEVTLQRVFAAFDYKKERWRDINNLSKFNTALGASLFAMPIILLLPMKSMVSVVAFLVLSMYIYNFFRIVYYFIAVRFSFLQSFLYLCAVEIVPFVLLWGIISRINIL